MTVDPQEILAELPLPLGPDAGIPDAIGVAVALEDALGVTLTDDYIDPAHLGDRAAIESTLHALTHPR